METEQLADLDELSRRIDESMLRDRYGLTQLARRIRQARKQKKPHDRNLKKLAALVEESTKLVQQRTTNLPRPDFDNSLPIAEKVEELQAAIRDHQVVVVCGETGSGKSTQLPKICLAMGRGVHGVIGHTQPRRIAARSVAARVAEELETPLGQKVGFKIRFTDATSDETYVKLMTDGILLAETQNDRFLNRYDTLIIDEAHERSLNIDFLMGYIKRLLPKRPELRLIITSATIDAERFSEHFAVNEQPAPVINVAGRTYPVEVRYRPLDELESEEEKDLDWRDGMIAAVEELFTERNRDVLVFLPTERDIREAAKVLRGYLTKQRVVFDNVEVLPLYGRLSTADQNRVFAPHGGRRIVLATNVAESSLTVPGIDAVIDLGLARISRYSSRSKLQRLPIEPISRASADQRKGRCGRVGPGVCIRLYSEADYNGRDEFTSPEILRTNLASVILQTVTLKLGDVEEFPFLDPPKASHIRDGYATLHELGAIDDEHRLTEIGRQLSRLPLDPRIGRMILAGEAEGCLHEVLIIASALEIQDPRERPVDKQEQADQAHQKFRHESSDFMSYLKLWDFYHESKLSLSNSRLRKACRDSFLNYNRLREWTEIHNQLTRLVNEAGWKPNKRKDDHGKIHRAMLAGLLSNVAYLAKPTEYTGAGGLKLAIWPGSVHFAKKPKWIVAGELVETTKRYARTVASIDPGWIEPLAGHLVKRSYTEPHWSRERKSVMANEKVSLYGLPVIPKRRVRYGRIDPVVSRELMIREGLVLGEFETNGIFLAENQKLVERLQQLQARTRQHHLLEEETSQRDFYESRVPSHCIDGHSFEKWRKEAEQQNPRVLLMTEKDLLREQIDPQVKADFPEAIYVEQMRLPLDYQLEPGTEDDGVTMTVPVEALAQLDAGLMEWLVPGLLVEKVTALIKGMPKQTRLLFVPAPDTAREVCQRMEFGQGRLLPTVAKTLGRLAGRPIPVKELEGISLPRHLNMNLKVVDGEGKVLGKGRDIAALRKKFMVERGASAGATQSLKLSKSSSGSGQASRGSPEQTPPNKQAQSAPAKWHREGITTWDFGDLPERIQVDRGGIAVTAFPTLVDVGKSVSLELYDQPNQALRTTRRGMVRLFQLASQKYLKEQLKWFPKLDQLELQAASAEGFRHAREQLRDLIARRAFFQEKSLPRSQAEFEQRVKLARNRVSVGVQDVAKCVDLILERFLVARSAIKQVSAPSCQYAVKDMKRQLGEMLRAGMFVEIPWNWLVQLPRYLQAIEVRCAKLNGAGLAKDQRHFDSFAPYHQRYVFEMNKKKRPYEQDIELEEYFWMLEEFRVSLFAQQIGTSVTVSPQRLDKQWKRVMKASQF